MALGYFLCLGHFFTSVSSFPGQPLSCSLSGQCGSQDWQAHCFCSVVRSYLLLFFEHEVKFFKQHTTRGRYDQWPLVLLDFVDANGADALSHVL